MSDLNRWIEWKQLCAAGLCSPGTRDFLERIGATRFAAHLKKYCHSANAGSPAALMERAGPPWHRFETFLLLRPTRAGKSYKEWLFARIGRSADDPASVIQAGVTLLLRDVVRDFLRQECLPARMESLQRTLADFHGRPVTLEDLLPSGANPADEAARHDLERLAHQQASATLERMDKRRRVALLAKSLRLSLAHPEVLRAAGCAKSVLHTAFRWCGQTLLDDLRSTHPGEDKTVLHALAMKTAECLEQKIILWGRAEKSCAHLFLLSGDAE